MPQPTIHSRVDLACEQLETAIEIFLDRNSPVSALTLAGAAEEILGKEVNSLGGTNELMRRYEERCRLLPRAGIEPPALKDFIQKENDARNAAKHISARKDGGRAYDPFLRGNLRWEATRMISRALTNARLLALPESAIWRRFDSWSLEQMIDHEEP